MCENELVAKYQALSQGSKVLESCLHRNLPEHINSEIGMGTITDIESAKKWLRGSFFYQRVQKHPDFYSLERLNGDQRSLSWQERLDHLVLSSIRNLEINQLIEMKKETATECLISTEYGEIMSKVGLNALTGTPY